MLTRSVKNMLHPHYSLSNSTLSSDKMQRSQARFIKEGQKMWIVAYSSIQELSFSTQSRITAATLLVLWPMDPSKCGSFHLSLSTSINTTLFACMRSVNILTNDKSLNVTAVFNEGKKATQSSTELALQEIGAEWFFLKYPLRVYILSSSLSSKPGQTTHIIFTKTNFI